MESHGENGGMREPDGSTVETRNQGDKVMQMGQTAKVKSEALRPEVELEIVPPRQSSGPEDLR